MTEVSQFYTLSHIFISFVGAVLLLVIHVNIKQRFRQILEEEDTKKRVDKGLLYLSLAMFVWVLSGLWTFTSDWVGFYKQFPHKVGIYLFSIANNMFFLLALFYFAYAPGFIYKNEKNVRLIFILIVVVTLSTLLASYFGGDISYYGIKLYALPDLILSAFLSYLLMVSIYRTFLHRGLKLVAIIAVLVVLLMFMTQLPEVFQSLENDFVTSVMKIIAKTSLIFLFLVLATSWVIQLANTPKATEIKIKFIEWSAVQLSIPSKEMNHVLIDFGSKTTQYKNLLKFAIRRKYGEGDQQSILVGAAGELKNQTYLSRIIDNINSINPRGSDQKLERKDLFTFLGEGRYRLRMLPKHISMDEQLMQEFVKQLDNRAYIDIIP